MRILDRRICRRGLLHRLSTELTLGLMGSSVLNGILSSTIIRTIRFRKVRKIRSGPVSRYLQTLKICTWNTYSDRNCLGSSLNNSSISSNSARVTSQRLKASRHFHQCIQPITPSNLPTLGSHHRLLSGPYKFLMRPTFNTNRRNGPPTTKPFRALRRNSQSTAKPTLSNFNVKDKLRPRRLRSGLAARTPLEALVLPLFQEAPYP